MASSRPEIPEISQIYLDLDDPSLIKSIGDALAGASVRITPIGSKEMAHSNWGHHAYLVIRFEGLEALPPEGEIPILVVDSKPSIERAVQAMKLGASHYIASPTHESTLAQEIEAFIQEANLDRGKCTQANLPWKSEALSHALKSMSHLTENLQHVLIVAPNGSESARIAQELHAQSENQQKSMQEVQCSVREKRSLLTQLLGNSRHAEKGIIEKNRQNSLYLEQLPTLTAHQVTRLFEALSQHQVRLIASVSPSNKNLKDEFFNSHFASPVIQLPPLRDRTEDIEPLAKELLLKHSQTPLQLSPSATESMKNYAWPSNYRELENVIERAVLLANGPVIEPNHLSLPTLGAQEGMLMQTESNSSLEDYFVNFVTAHERFLSETEIASRLGISRKSLWQRRQRLGIPRRYPRQ